MALSAVERDELDETMQRLSAPIVWTGTNVTFAGLGDSADAAKLLEHVRNATATAIRAIRQRVQGLEMGVYVRRFVDGDWEDNPAFDHPLQTLLDNPTTSPDGITTHTARQLWGTCVTQMHGTGETYLVVIHDGGGMPIELQLAVPGQIEPLLSEGRIVGYRILQASGAPRDVEPRDIVRIWEPDPMLLYTARGVVGNNHTLVSMDQAASASWDQFYQNDATPKLAFVSKSENDRLPTQEEEEAVARSWRARLHRIFGSRQGVPAWVKPGWDITKLTSQDEATAGATIMQHARRKVFEAFGVPPSIVGDVVDVNRAAAETSRYAFDVNTIEPLTLLMTEALTIQLANQYPVAPGANVQLIVKYKPFIARDKFFEIQRDQIQLQTKMVSINEARARQEPSLDPASWGDLPVGTIGEVPYTGEEEEVDLSAFDLETPPEEEEPEEVEEEAPGEEEERTRQLAPLARRRAHFLPAAEWDRQIRRDATYTPKFRSRQRSVFQRQGEITVERWLELESGRSGTRQDEELEDLVEALFPIEGWERMFQVTTEPVRAESYVSSADEATQAITGRAFVMTDVAQDTLRGLDATHYLFVNRSTQDALKRNLIEGLETGESTEQIARRIAETFGVRKQDATRIARTEIASAVQSAQVEGYRQTGVVEKKLWNTSLDGKVRDSHIIEGQTRDLDEPFSLGNGVEARSPADPALAPGDRVNCRCFVTPVFIDEQPLSVVGST